jgi:hypothetical protein
VTEYAYFGLDEKPVLHKKGYTRRALVYDERGNVIEEAYYGVNGNPVANEDGDVKITKTWHPNGEMATKSWSSLTKDGRVYVNQMQKYDEKGKKVEMISFDENGTPR